MATWKPDPTCYPSARMAGDAPKETLAYVASFDPSRQVADTLDVVDLDPASAEYGRIVHRLPMPNTGDELHHFGWNACSSCLCPNAPHAHTERRYLVVPGLRSSRIHIVDTKPDPRKPHIVRVHEPETVARRAGYTRPHTVHCGPEGIYVTELANAEGEAPGGIFLMDHESFDILGQWEIERGPQELAYDGWWHLGFDTLVTSEWGLPATFENGLVPEVLPGGRYGHRLHFWDLHTRRHKQTLDFGAENQLVFELRPAHKIIEIPAEPADPELLPPMLKGFGAVPPLVTDIALSLDDRYLYVACWGTGDLRQYGMSDPEHARLTGSVRIGGIAARAAHPHAPERALNGGPQMVEVSRDGERVYFTNSLYGAIDEQFYPDGIDGWMVKLDAAPGGGLAFNERFFIDWPKSHRPHQVRLEGGDCSSDSYCYP